MAKKKFTLSIETDIMKRAQLVAVDKGKSTSSVIEQAILKVYGFDRRKRRS